LLVKPDHLKTIGKTKKEKLTEVYFDLQGSKSSGANGPHCKSAVDLSEGPYGRRPFPAMDGLPSSFSRPVQQIELVGP